jgi:hypothetical protein
MLSPLPGGNPTTATSGCARYSRYWRSCCSSYTASSQSSRCWHLPGCTGVWNSSVFWQESTHTPRAAERAETRRICMCRGGKISIAAPLILLCMCAAATDLPSICLFCPAVCLFEAAHTAVHRNTATQHSHLPYKRLPYSYITPPPHIHYYHYHIPSRLHAYYLPIAEP